MFIKNCRKENSLRQLLLAGILFKQFQCTCGTDINTFSALCTNCNCFSFVEFRSDNSAEASADKTENALLCILTAHTHTKVTENMLQSQENAGRHSRPSLDLFLATLTAV